MIYQKWRNSKIVLFDYKNGCIYHRQQTENEQSELLKIWSFVVLEEWSSAHKLRLMSLLSIFVILDRESLLAYFFNQPKMDDVLPNFISIYDKLR